MSIYLSNSSCNIAFFFSHAANLFFRMFISKIKFPIFRFIIPMVSNNLVALFAFITFAATSSTDFGVLVYVIGSLDVSIDDPNSYTILLPNSNSNRNPSIDFTLLSGICNSVGLNFSKASCVTTLFVYSSIAYRPSYIYCCCFYKCCSKCYECCGLIVVSIQSSYTFASKCKCFSPPRTFVSCSSLTSCYYSLNYLSYGDVICGIFVINLTSCTTVGTAFAIVGIALTTVGIADGSTLPLIIFYAFRFMLSCSLLTLEPKAPPSSTMFFLLRTLIEKFATSFFLFSNVICISSLVLLTLAGGFCAFSFWYTNKY